MKRSSLLFVLLLSTPVLYGQQLQLIDSAIVESPVEISIDRQGNYYVCSSKGVVRKYNLAHELLAEYAPSKPGTIQLIEAWNPLRIFIFFESFQEYQILDRFLIASNRFPLNSVSSYAGIAAPSIDNNLWVVDYDELTLKKYALNFRQTLSQTALNQILDPANYEITHLREYKGYVFVSDRKEGILVFDNLGNYIKKISTVSTNYFGTLGDELYFIDGKKIVLINMLNSKKRNLDIDEPCDYVLIHDENILLFSKDQVKRYRFSAGK